jgi:hypothetical protein
MLHLDIADGELEKGAGVEVGGVDNVGDITVDKYIARLETQDGGFWDARVGTTNPDYRQMVSVCNIRVWESRMAYG